MNGVKFSVAFTSDPSISQTKESSLEKRIDSEGQEVDRAVYSHISVATRQ